MKKYVFSNLPSLKPGQYNINSAWYLKTNNFSLFCSPGGCHVGMKNETVSLILVSTWQPSCIQSESQKRQLLWYFINNSCKMKAKFTHILMKYDIDSSKFALNIAIYFFIFDISQSWVTSPPLNAIHHHFDIMEVMPGHLTINAHARSQHNCIDESGTLC